MKARNPDSDRSSNGEDETIKNGEDDWVTKSFDLTEQMELRRSYAEDAEEEGEAERRIHGLDNGTSLVLAIYQMVIHRFYPHSKRELQEELGVKLPNDALKRYSFFYRNDQSNPICKDGKQVNAARYAYLIREQRKLIFNSSNNLSLLLQLRGIHFHGLFLVRHNFSSSLLRFKNSTLRILRSLKERIKRLDKSKRKRRTKWMSKGRCEQGKEKEKEGKSFAPMNTAAPDSRDLNWNAQRQSFDAERYTRD
ncbi:predicted protein [Arabidopsis lyrata subsp. lyrata]|uniref:Predicted protein n=1 Tax=Arabidopsis lyrata subsp. lyrata TaxID=81972 RepID=D7MM29_ARALL|nr:predicted protein [Arabidopsis lyrata subsp. lyrata]